MTDSDPTHRPDRSDAPTAETSVDDESATEAQARRRNHRQYADVPTRSENRRRVVDGDPAFRCRHCGDPFVEERHLALHRGLTHAAALSETEREAYRDAYEREEADLKRFRLLSLGALVVLYFGFLFVYALVT